MYMVSQDDEDSIVVFLQLPGLFKAGNTETRGFWVMGA